MFSKILIANRGEIAARIMKTCKKMNIATVAIYSEADENNPYVRQADEAYCIGPAVAKNSYLRGDKIIALAKEVGADAIHPGFGFLSENDEFARNCEAAGITFIGPSADIIVAMGKKIQSRETMAPNGIPIIRGSGGALLDEADAVKWGNEIGYPVMLKASGGGGGIGMEIANNEEQVCKAFHKCKQRAGMSFGDDTVYMEKYIREPRHIEVQIIADKYGHVWHVGERDCSCQRRHQKVIEESPALPLNQELREKMCAAAIKAATVIGYDSAGTVEMLLDADKNFYFLEVNTRIQVEHGVTEMCNGVDIVELMIRAAAGEEITENPYHPEGHTIECRIYAEDPYTFFPSCGVLKTVEFPQGDGIRIDHSVESGQEVTPFYDPMIAKLLVHADDRKSCIARMLCALKETQLEGIKTNIPFMVEVLKSDKFNNEGATTSLADEVVAKMKAEKKAAGK